MNRLTQGGPLSQIAVLENQKAKMQDDLAAQINAHDIKSTMADALAQRLATAQAENQALIQRVRNTLKPRGTSVKP